jgi:hypothetical protein
MISRLFSPKAGIFGDQCGGVRVLKQVIVIVIGVVVVLAWVVKEAIDMASRVDWVEQNLPGAIRWAESKRWQRVMILVTMLLIVGMAYEVWTEPEAPRVSLPSIDPAAKDAKIIQQAQEIATLKQRPESCPKCEARSTARLDILCQNLADCPSVELAKRAGELIAKLRAIMEPYNTDVKRWENALGAEPGGSPAYNDLERRMDQSLKGEVARVMGNYRVHHTEVLAMREALIRRVGHSDEDEDYEYQLVGTTQGNISMVDRVISDLSKLTAGVRNLRQH